MRHSKPMLLLSGTPASGKDTITRLLLDINSQFRHFKKHRASSQPKNDGTYIHVTPGEFHVMAEQGDFLQHHYRYDRGYGVSLNVLHRHWANGGIPIIHVGKYENISPLRAPETKTISVLIMVSVAETERRLKQRHNNDSEEIHQRITAYHEERAKLADLINLGAHLEFDLMIENEKDNPERAAKQIAQLFD